MLSKFNNYFSFIKREGKEELLDYLRRTDYFEAPASGGHHLATTGGLLEHSLNVAEMMFNVADTLTRFNRSREHGNSSFIP